MKSIRETTYRIEENSSYKGVFEIHLNIEKDKQFYQLTLFEENTDEI